MNLTRRLQLVFINLLFKIKTRKKKSCYGLLIIDNKRKWAVENYFSFSKMLRIDKNKKQRLNIQGIELLLYEKALIEKEKV